MTETAEQTRLPLTRERVLRAAIQIADEGGIGELTMRKLAASLGVEAMSLYHHVANKDDILDGIIDFVAEEIDITEDPGETWKETAWRRSVSVRESLERHPWVALLWVSRLSVGEARMRYMDAALRNYREAGLGEALTHHAYHAVENHILGYTLQQLSFGVAVDDLQELGKEFLRTLPRDEYPDLALHVHQHVEGPKPDDETEFEFGLRLILDGVERLHLDT